MRKEALHEEMANLASSGEALVRTPERQRLYILEEIRRLCVERLEYLLSPSQPARLSRRKGQAHSRMPLEDAVLFRLLNDRLEEALAGGNQIGEYEDIATFLSGFQEREKLANKVMGRLLHHLNFRLQWQLENERV